MAPAWVTIGLVFPSAHSHCPAITLDREEKVLRDRIGDRVKGCTRGWVHGAKTRA